MPGSHVVRPYCTNEGIESTYDAVMDWKSGTVGVIWGMRKQFGWCTVVIGSVRYADVPVR